MPTFLQFKTQSIDRISELEKQLEEVNESWYNHLKNGQDDNDIHTDAYHCKMNAKRLVYKLEELTA